MKKKPRDLGVELWTLPLGSAFEIVGLEDCYRNLRLQTVTESCANIKGESAVDDFSLGDDKVTKKRNWKPLSSGWTVSVRTPVRPLPAK